MKDLQEKAYEIIDQLLKDLSNSKKPVLFNVYAIAEKVFAKDIMKKYAIVNFTETNKQMSLVRMNMKTKDVLNAGGIKKYLDSISQGSEEKENLEMQKLRLENEKLVDEIIDYQSIKSQRKWLFLFAAFEFIIIIFELIHRW